MREYTVTMDFLDTEAEVILEYNGDYFEVIGVDVGGVSVDFESCYLQVYAVNVGTGFKKWEDVNYNHIQQLGHESRLGEAEEHEYERTRE